MELTDYTCGKENNSRGFTCYCDHCPIGALGIGTCMKSQQYSK